MLDIYGRFFNRIHDTTTKFGYLSHPVNMMDLEKEDMVELMTNPSNHWNRGVIYLLIIIFRTLYILTKMLDSFFFSCSTNLAARKARPSIRAIVMQTAAL